MKQLFGCRKLHSSEEVEMAARKWLRVQEMEFYHNQSFKNSCQTVTDASKCFATVVKNNDTAVE
jgi:hypothetical protein